MNENIDLTKILKDCPTGTKLYTSVWGEVTFIGVNKNCAFPICIYPNICRKVNLTKDGCYAVSNINSKCILFPSKDQRDWSKFTAPWYKKDKFDPKSLQPFDKVLVRDSFFQNWTCGFFSHIVVFDNMYRYNIAEVLYKMCIPYNDETKHLVGTTDEAPEYYRYWED